MLAHERLENAERLWWLSFADADGFRGVVIVRAHGLISAVRLTHQLGVNPGGEVAGSWVDERALERYELNRRYSRAEIDQLGRPDFI